VLSGCLIIVLGLWGALVPLVGPYFHYAFGSYNTWHVSTARLWLDILPGVVAVIGGVMLVLGATRVSGLIGGWLAVGAGLWFAVGPTVSLLWHDSGDPIGAPLGGHVRRAFELLVYFQGLGVVIAALAAFAMGRYFSRPQVVDEPIVAPTATPAATRTDSETVAEHGLAPDEVTLGREEPLPPDETEDEPDAHEQMSPLTEEGVSVPQADPRGQQAG
jgi:hypothetical protein